ncbi:hypothetical protein EMCRGX_G034463 [Ephydatia muelleri]
MERTNFVSLTRIIQWGKVLSGYSVCKTNLLIIVSIIIIIVDVKRALVLFQELDPSLGLFVNITKREVLSCNSNMKQSEKLNVVLLEIPIGDTAFCSICTSPHKLTDAKSSSCKARRADTALLLFLGYATKASHHLKQAIETFNSLVSPTEATSLESPLSPNISQKIISSKALFDVRVVDTDAPSHCHRALNAILESSSEEKKRMYKKAVEDRRGTFTPFVLSVDGLLHKEASHFLRHMATAL